ncbi:MAG TPA: hypothetical protein VM260_12815, partial [Pirellula sp.]|nr:hypothetical protein [Pirellula sp.]
LLLSVVQFDLFWRSYIEDQKSWRWWYLAVSVSSLYVNILLGLTLVAQNILLWSSLRTKAALHHLSSLVIAGVVYVPMFLLQVRSLIEKDIPIDNLGFAKVLQFVVGTLTYNLAPMPRIDSTLMLRSGLAIILVAIGSWTIRLYWRQIAMRHRAVWNYLLAVACLLVLFLVATNLRTNPRYTFPIVIASLLAWGQLTDLIRNQSLVAAVWIASQICCFGTLTHTYSPLCKTGDWIRVSWSHMKMQTNRLSFSFPKSIPSCDTTIVVETPLYLFLELREWIVFDMRISTSQVSKPCETCSIRC